VAFTAPVLLAHAGHWLVSLAYAIPVAGVAGFLAISTFRARRRTPNTTSQGDER